MKGFIIIEMTLEPIIGPDLTEYLNSITSSYAEGLKRANLINAEKERIKMYRQVINIVEYVSPEASDLLKDLTRRSDNLTSLL